MTLQTETFTHKTEDQPVVVGVGTLEDMQFISLTEDETGAVINALETALEVLAAIEGE